MLRLENLLEDWLEFVGTFTAGFVQPEPGPNGAIAQVNEGAKRPGSNGDHTAKGFSAFYGAENPGAPDISRPICRYLSNDYSILSVFYKPPLQCEDYYNMTSSTLSVASG